MFPLVRIAAVAYVLSIFVGGYLAVATLKGIWTEAGRFERLASLSEAGANELDRTLLTFDSITPSSGDITAQ